MQSGSEQSLPRHRGVHRATHDDVVPRVTTPGTHRLTGPVPVAAEPVVLPADPHRSLPDDAPVRGPRIGFRSTREVVAEMSPVIYRPGDDPDHEPERPPRVSIAGPGVPTAASFADETGAPDLDEDPEIAEDELVDEAEDALLDELEESAVADPPDDFDALDDPHFDDHLHDAPPQQRRRRRLLGRHDDEPVVPPLEELPVAPRRRRVRTLHISAPPTGPGEPEPEQVEPEQIEQDEPVTEPVAQVPPDVTPEVIEPEPQPEPETVELGSESDPEVSEPTGRPGAVPAVSGHVASTRGRGLSGMTVSVLDLDGEVVTTVVTGRHGRFGVDGLAPGSYRLSAGDQVDGDFGDAWFGGATADDARPLQVDDGLTAGDVDVALPARVVVLGDVDVLPDRVVVVVSVTDRTSGLPGSGAVVLSTEHFSTRLELADGRATITLFGTTDGDDTESLRLGKRLRVEYLGTEHTAAQSRTLRLR